MTSSNGKFFRVTGLCEGNSPVTGEFPSQRPVSRSFGVFFDVCRINNRETGYLRRHRAHYDVIVMVSADRPDNTRGTGRGVWRWLLESGMDWSGTSLTRSGHGEMENRSTFHGLIFCWYICYVFYVWNRNVSAIHIIHIIIRYGKFKDC